MFKFLGKTKVSCQELIKGYLPEYRLECKQKAFERAMQVHGQDNGDIEVSHVMCDKSISDEVLTQKSFRLNMDREFYDYRKARSGEDTWFVNFADPQLFVAAEGALFAQDEIQTLEMPLLAALRRYIDSNHIGGFAPYTAYSGNPTPYLFKNVPYWIKVDTRPLLRNGTRGNIYGSNLVTASEEEIEAGAKQLYDLALTIGDDEAESIDYLRIQSIVFGTLSDEAKTADNFDPLYIYLDRQAPTVTAPESKYQHGWSNTRSFAFSFAVSDTDSTLGEGVLPEEREGNEQINKSRDLSTVTQIQIGDLVFAKPEKGWGAADVIEGVPAESQIEDPETEKISVVTAMPEYSITLIPVKNQDGKFEGTFNAEFVPDDKTGNYFKLDLNIIATDCCNHSNDEKPETVHIQIDTFKPAVKALTVTGLEDGKDGERVLQKSSQDVLEIELTADDRNTDSKSSGIESITVQYGNCEPWKLSNYTGNSWTGTLRIPLENSSRREYIKVLVTDSAGNTGTYYYTRENNADTVTPDVDKAVKVVTDLQEPAQPDFPDVVQFATNEFFEKQAPGVQFAVSDAYTRIQRNTASPQDILVVKNYFEKAQGAFRAKNVPQPQKQTTNIKPTMPAP